jgi:hypothetical protein
MKHVLKLGISVLRICANAWFKKQVRMEHVLGHLQYHDVARVTYLCKDETQYDRHRERMQIDENLSE